MFIHLLRVNRLPVLRERCRLSAARAAGTRNLGSGGRASRPPAAPLTVSLRRHCEGYVTPPLEEARWCFTRLQRPRLAAAKHSSPCVEPSCVRPCPPLPPPTTPSPTPVACLRGDCPTCRFPSCQRAGAADVRRSLPPGWPPLDGRKKNGWVWGCGKPEGGRVCVEGSGGGGEAADWHSQSNNWVNLQR